MIALFCKNVRSVFVFLAIAVFCSQPVNAQKKQAFDPIKFEADLEKFIASEVELTPAEASEFFPVYREMRKKQLAYFRKERCFRKVDTKDAKACAEAIRKRDKNEVELKVLQKNYHERFLTILPATKVFKILKAERKFHKQCFRKAKPQKK